MAEVTQFLSLTGSESIRCYWVPLFIWTILALLVKVGLSLSRGLSARYLYHMHLALTGVLPCGYLSYAILHSFTASNKMAGSFMVFQFGLPQISATAAAAPGSELSPDTWIGMVMFLLTVVILFKFFRLFTGGIKLRAFRRTLNLRDYREITEISSENRNLIQSFSFRRSLRIAFTPERIVPMAFGAFNAVIVLPEPLKKDPAALNLAVHHELEHIRQHDYIRFWLVRLINVFFWFHPLVRQLERDLTLYREMDIDQTVTTRYRNLSSEYAHLLLKLADTPAPDYIMSTGLAMHPSTITQRIIAMSRIRKTHQRNWIRAVPMILILLITVAMACNNTVNDHPVKNRSQAVNPPSKGEDFGTLNAKNKPLFILDGTVIDQKRMRELDSKQIQSVHVWKGKMAVQKFGERGKSGVVVITTKKENTGFLSDEMSQSRDKPFTAVKQFPKLIGGLAKLQAHIHYPEQARKAGIEGTVYIQFIVDKQGNVEDPKVIRGIGGGCDQAALDAVKKAHFTPGMQGGKPVNVRFSLPVVFKLPKR